ncbi:putative zinc-binding metallopeptidase [Tenacibaculum sp.]|uniref:putative zinc-binding metallopeptidase n=1 Tax=Tenacibaculum sp. TaxID=1906242 RepID=UPI003D0E0793
MKNIKRIYIFLFVVLSIFAVNVSCSNDDEIVIAPTDATDTSGSGGDTGTTGTVEGSEGEITLYKVDGDEISKIQDYKVKDKDLEYQKDIAKHQEIWELVKKIVPADQRKKLGEFLIYNGEVTGSAGFVIEMKSDLSVWQMGIAINYAYEGGFNAGGELAYTIIHEFGHVLTLDNTQLDAAVTQENCKNYFPGEGCAFENSYINELHSKYWNDIWSEYQEAKKDESAQEKFYEKYKERYVTQYASTNPGEDIAEVFATFTTLKDKPEGKTIAEKKILLMYDRSELVAFRDHIRKNLALRGKGNAVAFELPEPGKWKQATTFGNPHKTKCRRH